jgi:ribonuclease P protein component
VLEVLPKEQRLKRSGEFKFTVRTGARKKAGGLVLYRAEVAGDEVKVGFIVGKDVGNAVTRHRLSRRLRHIVRELPTAPKGTHSVVRCLPSASTSSFKEMFRWLESIW